MKKLIAFFKEHNSLLVNFWINQVVWSVVGLMISWPLSIMFDESENYSLYMWLALVFTAGIFCFRVYDMLNQFGLKFSIRKNNPAYTGNSIPTDSFGLKIALFGYAPTFLLVLLYAIFFLVGFDKGTPIMVAIIYMLPIHSFYNAGFLALSGVAEGWRLLYTVLSLAPAIVFCWLGYYLGVRDKGVIAREKANKE